MGRRRKEGLADVLVTLPWQVSAGLAVASFIGMRWFLPGLLPSSAMGDGLRAGLQGLVWLPPVFFGVLALIAFLRARFAVPPKEANLEKRNGRTKPARPAPVPPPSPDMWGDSAASAPIREVAPAIQSWERTGTAAASRSSPALHQQSPATDPNFQWSPEALRALEWKRFELLCARYYEAVGFKSETLAAGPDGGIDVKLYKIDPNKPLAVVQCKAWSETPVGVKEVRELLGVMAHEKVSRGIFITTSEYTADALAFGAANPIQLLDGPAFAQKLLELPADKQQALRAFAFEGDYRTPTCASCGVKMVRREGKRGAFWGCVRYPQCRSTLPLRRNE